MIFFFFSHDSYSHVIITSCLSKNQDGAQQTFLEFLIFLKTLISWVSCIELQLQKSGPPVAGLDTNDLMELQTNAK